MKNNTWFLVLIILAAILVSVVSCASPTPASTDEQITTKNISIPIPVNIIKPTKIFASQNDLPMIYRFDDDYFICFITSTRQDLNCFHK